MPADLVYWILAEVVTRAPREPVYYTLGKAAVCYQRFGASTHQLTEQVHTRTHADTHTRAYMHARTHACLHTQTHNTHRRTLAYTHTMHACRLIHNTRTNNNNHNGGKWQCAIKLFGRETAKAKWLLFSLFSKSLPCTICSFFTFFSSVKGDTKLRHKMDRKCRNCVNISYLQAF